MAVDAVDVLQELLEAHDTGDTTRMAEIRAQLTPGEIDAVVATAVGELVNHALAEIATKTGLEGSP